MRDLLLRARLVVGTSNMEISRRHLADVKTWHNKACRTCSTIIFPHSTKQINHFTVILSLPLLSSFLKAWLNARNNSTRHRITLFHDVATFAERAGQTHATFSTFSRQHVDVYVPMQAPGTLQVDLARML